MNDLCTQLIEKDAELSKLRNQYSELLIRYDALRTITNISTIPPDDDKAQRQAMVQALDMGKIFKR